MKTWHKVALWGLGLALVGGIGYWLVARKTAAAKAAGVIRNQQGQVTGWYDPQEYKPGQPTQTRSTEDQAELTRLALADQGYSGTGGG